MKNRLLALAVIAEAATGPTLLMVASLVGRLLLGAELSRVSVLIGRVTGHRFGRGCWPGPAIAGMLTYSAGVTLLLARARFTE